MSCVIDGDFHVRLERLASRTVSGRPIDLDEGIQNDEFDRSYPIRFHLRQLSNFIWYELLKEGKREQDIARAIEVVERQFEECLSRSDAAPPTPRKDDAKCRNIKFSAEWLDLLRDERQSVRRAEAPTPRTHVPPLREWCIETDPTDELELLEDDWLQRKELWQVEQNWTWAHVYDFLALLTMDVALSNVEHGEPYRAAIAAARATEYHGTATAVRWSDATENATLSTLGKRGSDVRHSSNRAAKDEAIRIFLSKTWPSQAQAARLIANTVKRTERVVEKWIREYRRSPSTGTVMS